uniref:HnRNP M nuclear localisation signal domain-containing protein n=1 Tax=Apteryx owenii TaxID=8824 RepID=A0A8B9Q8X8_APTOW
PAQGLPAAPPAMAAQLAARRSAGTEPPRGGASGSALGERPSQNEKRKEKSVKRGGNRFEPYANPAKRYRAFITNIPFDVKWQSLKDLVKEKGLCFGMCCNMDRALEIVHGVSPFPTFI